ncbi:jg25092, partial [Pararge aegeria aegeria]
MMKVSKEALYTCINSVLQTSMENSSTLEFLELHMVLKDYDPRRERRVCSVKQLRFTTAFHKMLGIGDQQQREEVKRHQPFLNVGTLKRLNKGKKNFKNKAKSYDAFFDIEH